MNTIKKIGLVSVVAFALFAFNACGDDSGSSSGPGDNGGDFTESSDSRDDGDYSSDSEDEDYSSDSEDDYSSDSDEDDYSFASDDENSSSSSRIIASSSSSHVIASSAGAKQSSGSSGNAAKVMPTGYYKTNCPASLDCKDATSSLEYLNQEMLAAGKYGEMLDTRDGQVYKTTEICDSNNENCQTWMAQNLNYAPDENQVHSLGDYAWSGCYGGKADSCAKYGRLYTWEVAMDKAGCGYGESCNNSYEGTQGICLSGWHLPTYAEWETLFENVGGKNVAGRMLKSEEGWNYYFESTEGIDYYGFSALPAGYSDVNGDFHDAGDVAYFWSSSELYSSGAYGMNLYYVSEGASLNYYSKIYAFSVRCLKD